MKNQSLKNMDETVLDVIDVKGGKEEILIQTVGGDGGGYGSIMGNQGWSKAMDVVYKPNILQSRTMTTDLH